MWQRKMITNLIVVVLLTTSNLDGPRSEILPDNGMVLHFEKSGDISCLLWLGVQHAFEVLARMVLDDRYQPFNANMVLEYTQVAIGWNYHCVIGVQAVLELWEDLVEFLLVD